MEKLQQLHEWFTLADYAEAGDAATRRIVKRYTRGNVSAQNGRYLNENALAALSEQGDRAAARLQRKIHS
jgi:hypothetical protein